MPGQDTTDYFLYNEDLTTTSESDMSAGAGLTTLAGLDKDFNFLYDDD